MSASFHTWYSWHDLELLARRRAVLEGRMTLDCFSRLATLLSSDEGAVNARLSFQQDASGHVVMSVVYDARMMVVCQRCLEAMAHTVEADARFFLFENEAVPTEVPESVELLNLNGDRFNPAEFIEDELIVSLPLVSRHARADDCGELASKLDKFTAGAGDTRGQVQISH